MMYTIKKQPEDFIVEEIRDQAYSDQGRYSILLMKKRNYTTQRAIEAVARALRVKPRSIGYAGIKDKNAVTTQHISLPIRVKQESLDLKDIGIRLLGFSDAPIHLGDLKGNTFRITVRDSSAEPKRLDEFLNLFGEQRFSSTNPEIGEALIRKHFKEATRLITETNVGYGVEEHLKSYPNDHVGALRRVPIPLLKLFVHSYQSKLWNRMAIRLDQKPKDLPLIGFDTELHDTRVQQVLQEEGLSPGDFIIRQLPELSLEGEYRKTYARINDLEIEGIGEGEFRLSFWLGKGCYATVAVNQMIQGLPQPD